MAILPRIAERVRGAPFSIQIETDRQTDRQTDRLLDKNSLEADDEKKRRITSLIIWRSTSISLKPEIVVYGTTTFGI